MRLRYVTLLALIMLNTVVLLSPPNYLLLAAVNHYSDRVHQLWLGDLSCDIARDFGWTADQGQLLCRKP
jgi:hypothetical protein